VQNPNLIAELVRIRQKEYELEAERYRRAKLATAAREPRRSPWVFLVSIVERIRCRVDGLGWRAVYWVRARSLASSDRVPRSSRC
jgi:hypothetical protein